MKMLPLRQMKKLVKTAGNDDNPKRQLQAVQSIRKLLSCDSYPPIDEFIKCGILPILVRCLKRHENKALQLDAAWALTNMTSGTSEQTNQVVNSGAVPFLIQLLQSPDANVCEQAVWGLGNIIGDGEKLRDFCIETGVVTPLLALVKPTIPISTLRNVAWVILNLCRHKNPPLAVAIIKQILPVLCDLIRNKDVQVLEDTAWALSHLSNIGSKTTQLVIDSGIVRHLVPLLSHAEDKLKVALRAVGNIVLGTNDQTQVVLDCKALNHFPALLKNPKMKIRQEALLILSNIHAGTESQIQAVIDAGLLPKIIESLSSNEFLVQREAVWAVVNLVTCGSEKQAAFLIQIGALPPLFDLLRCDNLELIKLILEGIKSIFEKAQPHAERIATLIDDFEGWAKINELQNHENFEIYKLAYDLIDQYFRDDT